MDICKVFGFMLEYMYEGLEIDGNGVVISYCEIVGGCVLLEKLDNIVG